MSNLWKEISIVKYSHEVAKDIMDTVIMETPLTIYLNDRELVTLLCSPSNLEELAIGFLAAEGFINKKEDIIRIDTNQLEGTVRVSTSFATDITEKTFLKRYITTGCGRGTTFYHVQDSLNLKKVEKGFQVEGALIIKLVQEAQKQSELFLKTGGVHSAGLAGTWGFILFREDIGRHNAVDKIFGRTMLDKIALSDKILIITGRISSEIMIKTAKAGIPILVSRSAPTDLAVRIAEETGITLIGFARGQRFNIYTHGERTLGEGGIL